MPISMASGALSLGLLSLSVVPAVQAHFFVNELTTGGEGSSMYDPWGDEYRDYPDRIERRFDDNWPVWDIEGEAGDDIRCNRYNDGADDDQPAASVRTVQAGEDITLRWSTYTDFPTSHMGPVITYMAHCDNDDCTTFQSERNKVWFKIDEKGYDASKYDASIDDGTESQVNCWASTTMAQGSNYTLQIPASLKSGQYLLRHEIIALHAAQESWGGAIADDAKGSQHYMNCMQLDVQSDGTDFPSDEYLVSFPGAYSKDDPGLLIDIWWPRPLASSYIIPGPKLWTGSNSNSTVDESYSSASASTSVSAASSIRASTVAAVATNTEDAPTEATTGTEATTIIGSDSTDENETADPIVAPVTGEQKLKKCGATQKRRMAKF